MNTPVFVDSPLAISATEIFKKNEELFDDETKGKIESGDNPLEFPGLSFTRTPEESMALNESKNPSIIISASGMCEIGRIKHHLKHNIWNPINTILFVGYQAPGTLGRKIVDGAKTIKLFGDEVAVNARIEYIEGYSGHADQEWLLNFIYSFYTKPKYIFLVHGEEESQIVLKQKILENTSIPVIIPEYGETYEINEKLKLSSKIDMTNKYKPLRLELLERMETLKEEVEEMAYIVKKEKLSEDTNDNELIQLNQKIKELEKMIVNIIE